MFFYGRTLFLQFQGQGIIAQSFLGTATYTHIERLRATKFYKMIEHGER